MNKTVIGKASQRCFKIRIILYNFYIKPNFIPFDSLITFIKWFILKFTKYNTKLKSIKRTRFVPHQPSHFLLTWV